MARNIPTRVRRMRVRWEDTVVVDAYRVFIGRRVVSTTTRELTEKELQRLEHLFHTGAIRLT